MKMRMLTGSERALAHTQAHMILVAEWEELTDGLPPVKKQFYNELIESYNSSNRMYHNLHHIQSLLTLSKQYRHLLQSPKTVDFAIWYHDAVYDASQSDNEELSAKLAKDHLTKLCLDEEMVSDCCKYIMATKNHQLNQEVDSFDVQFFLDIDLSILATDRTTYLEYTKQIRQEYHMYPEALYHEGRKKVLAHFLGMRRIYKTGRLQNLWEQQARENLSYELSSL